MEILFDSVLAFLSSVGLWTLGKMLLKNIYADCAFDAGFYILKEDTSGWT